MLEDKTDFALLPDIQVTPAVAVRRHDKICIAPVRLVYHLYRSDEMRDAMPELTGLRIVYGDTREENAKALLKFWSVENVELDFCKRREFVTPVTRHAEFMSVSHSEVAVDEKSKNWTDPSRVLLDAYLNEWVVAFEFTLGKVERLAVAQLRIRKIKGHASANATPSL
jgi:hypothetical protein